MQEFNFQIFHRKGECVPHVDFLSRRFEVNMFNSANDDHLLVVNFIDNEHFNDLLLVSQLKDDDICEIKRLTGCDRQPVRNWPVYNI